jgi:hypothetical protein
MIGSGVIIFISSFSAVKDILDKQASLTGDRPKNTIGDTVTGGYHMAQAHYRETPHFLCDSSPNNQTIRCGSFHARLHIA